MNFSAIRLAVVFTLISTMLSAEVKHGAELVRGVNCGIPEGTVLEPSAEKQFGAACVITDKAFGAVKTTHTEAVVKFVRCKFVNPGFVSMSGSGQPSTGTEYYTVQRAGKGSVELEDCEVYGGKSVAVNGVDKITRTYIAEGNDLIRSPEGLSFCTEVLGEKLLMSSPASHSDIMQVTFGKDRTLDKPAVATIHVVRCKFDARRRTDASGKSLDGTNASIQLGSFGPNTGVQGEITDCYFDGGSATLGGGGNGDFGKPVKVSGCTFGRHCKYMPIHPGWRQNHDIDNSNVWADTRQPAQGKP